MRCILEYMYKGEVKINLDRLGDFLNIAKELEISQLHESEEQSPNNENQDENSLSDEILDENKEFFGYHACS